MNRHQSIKIIKMGLFDSIKRNMPGSPVSVAKTMLKIYRSYRRNNPHCSDHDAYRYTIETRYVALKPVSQDTVELILEKTDCLETLVFLTFCAENDLLNLLITSSNMHPSLEQLFEKISNDLMVFFEKNAPNESYFGKEYDI